MDKANFEIKFKSQDVFGEGGPFAGGDVEEKTRQAFKITVKKLDKLNAPSEKHKEDLRRERLDQVSREFPFPKFPFFSSKQLLPVRKKGPVNQRNCHPRQTPIFEYNSVPERSLFRHNATARAINIFRIVHE